MNEFTEKQFHGCMPAHVIVDNDLFIGHYEARVRFHDVGGNIITMGKNVSTNRNWKAGILMPFTLDKEIGYIETNSEKETIELGKKIASKLTKGMVIVLTGDLGSGKTKFTEGFLRYFGLDNEISSPTFNIVNEYKKDDLKIYHFDVYRLEDIEEFYAIGGEEYFSSGICLIEWAENIEDVLPDNVKIVKIEKIKSS